MIKSVCTHFAYDDIKFCPDSRWFRSECTNKSMSIQIKLFLTRCNVKSLMKMIFLVELIGDEFQENIFFVISRLVGWSLIISLVYWQFFLTSTGLGLRYIPSVSSIILTYRFYIKSITIHVFVYTRFLFHHRCYIF